MHYDNHANPLAISGDGYAWQTWFDHVAAQFSLPFEFGLLGQWIDGSTRMGVDLGPWLVQDVDFDSYFVTLTRSFGHHRASVRYEKFDLQPFNDPIGITNQDRGDALAIAWQFQAHPRLRVGAEYLRISSEHCRNDRCFWVFQGLPRETEDSQVQITARWYFAGSGRIGR